MEFLKDLNERQREAVEQTEGPVMIIAGAGSGKTRVLTYRIAHKIRQGADPFNILALTFTNKAARSMKERIQELAGDEAAFLWMGTFHSIFARILRFEHDKINYPSNFTIYDTEDSKNLLKDIIRGQSLDEKIYKPDTVLNRISSAKNSLLSADEYCADSEIQNEDKLSNRPLLGNIYRAYEARCKQSSALDFDDLLYRTYLLLRDFPEVLYKYQNKFKYILVDEFQDTNFLQYTILKKLSAKTENICVVGDDAQSIYAFRGANIQNILNFEKDYPDLKVFRLEQNYRSTQTIVNAANSVIVHNKKQLHKTVWTENGAGEKVKLFRSLTDNEEGNVVAQSIFHEKMNLQRKYIDFAILYRTNAQSRSMEEALRKMNIPYRIYGGLSFYKRKEIKDLLAYFRMAINPKDEEALKRIINFPARGIGDTTVERIIVAADEQQCSLWEIIENIHQSPVAINGPTKSRIADFAVMIKSFAVEVKTKDAFDSASFISTKSGLLKELYNDKTPEGVSRYENIQELLNGIKEFTVNPADFVPQLEPGEVAPAAGEAAKTLDVFMQDIALLTDADETEEGNQDRVSLMTIHAAKGLEFEHVFIVGLEENLFPSQFALNSRDELEEERRLFYVAITRAKEKLTLSYAASRYRWGNLTGCEPSRFISDIDPQFIEAVGRVKQQQNGEQVFHSNQRSYPPKKYGNYAAQKPAPTTEVVLPPGNFKRLNKRKGDVAVSAFEASDASLIRAGMNVEHERFGTGKVLQLEGNAPDLKATIFFQGHGQKQLLLRFAKLKIAE